MFGLICFIFVATAQDNTYYVATTGTDSASCGDQAMPCATINRVVDNYPGASFTVSIAAGNYTPTSIILQRDAAVILQGVDNPMINPIWTDVDFINTFTSYGIYDLSISLKGEALQFSTLYHEGQLAEFFNVNVIYTDFKNGTFVMLEGGSLMMNNVTVTGGRLFNYFIARVADGETTNITVTGSKFSHLTMSQFGSIMYFNAYETANVLLNDTIFDSISVELLLVYIVAMDVNQTVIISNNVFNNIDSGEYYPSVYVENDNKGAIIIQNTTWNNVYSDGTAGALETVGPNDGSDHNITLNNLKFTGCYGVYAGAVFVAYNFLNMSDCVFEDNTGRLGNDVVQGFDSGSGQYGYSITNSFSSSALPKAVIWDTATNNMTDISSFLPDPSEAAQSIRPSTHGDDSVSPTFGRKIQKKN